MDTREVFLPAEVLGKCLDSWETADDLTLAKAVGEAVERAFWHWRWLLAIRQYSCRLVVVQHRDAHGTEMMPHYQLGDLLTLSGWHPDRALEESRSILDNSGDGLTFDLPVDAEWLAEWDEIIDSMDMEEESEDDFSNVELLTTAMLLMDEAHDTYVEELGEDFYIATRGPERNIEQLLDDPYGRWSHETMQIVDRDASAAQVHIFTEQPEAMKTKVPIVYQPTVSEDDEETDEDGPYDRHY